jgi:Na+-transporting methylmalonyl-CoA/oxaloacetate decarboxylase gamma subunit
MSLGILSINIYVTDYCELMGVAMVVMILSFLVMMVLQVIELIKSLRSAQKVQTTNKIELSTDRSAINVKATQNNLDQSSVPDASISTSRKNLRVKKSQSNIKDSPDRSDV